MFKCPSDRQTATWNNSDETGDSFMSAYDHVGTSYPMNWTWWTQTHSSLAGSPPAGEDAWSWRARLGVKLWLGQMNRQGSRFIAMLEDPAEFGINANWVTNGAPSDSDSGGMQVIGFHGRFSRHVALYLDGHVAYRFMDTRHTHESRHIVPGPRHREDAVVGSWTVVDETIGPDGHASSGRHL